MNQVIFSFIAVCILLIGCDNSVEGDDSSMSVDQHLIDAEMDALIDAEVADALLDAEIADAEVADALIDAEIAPCPNPAEQMPVGLSAHFQAFLAQSDFAEQPLVRLDLEGGSFGGYECDTDQVIRQPVIFVHNTDRAIGGPTGGWTESVAAFMAAGYRPAELLYATTYGPARVASASLTYHSRENVMQVRYFIEAVLANQYRG